VGRLHALRANTHGRIVFTTSFGLEDQVLTHHIIDTGLTIELVTLDTGRLFPQTYDLWATTEAKYGRRIRAIYPDAQGLEDLIVDQGINGFYFSPDMRKACCHVRKVAPLARALQGADVWITGLRGDASVHRQALPFVTNEPERNLIKANPLLDWSREQVLQEATRHDIPINSLHAQGFLSIGCAPCTRAVPEGAPERSGRWWWEDEHQKECGLHVADVTPAHPTKGSITP
jgi:phosphoadenosine phosphosulfate reductase